MALTLKDRVLETCTSPGTGAVTLLGAVTGYQTFSSAIGNANTCYYTIADQNGANWEVGIGTYATSGNTLTRTTVLSSSNAGSTVNFATGTQNVFVTYPSERSVNLSSSALTSGRVTYATTDGLLTDSANMTFNGTTFTLANDASISGLTVGKGANSLATNTLFGSGLGAVTTGNINSAFGYSNLNLNTSGVGNSAFGVTCLSNNTTGTYNSAFGYEALNQNTTASHNSAFGYETLKANTTGSSNVGYGNYALFSNTTASNNTAVGYQAGYSNQLGVQNTFIGSNAGYNSNPATGTGYNTCVGYFAGYGLTTGVKNTFIGSFQSGGTTGAGSAITTGSANSILGAFTGNGSGLDIRTANNYIVLSDGDGVPRQVIDTNGNVGIGTTSNNVFDQVGAPRPLLVQRSDTSTTIAGSLASITISNGDTTTNNTAQINFAAITGASTNQYSGATISAIFGARTNGQYPSGQLVFSTSTATNSAPTEKMRIDSSGNVGIGTSSPAQKLDVVGSAKASVNVFCGDAYAFVFGTGTTSYWTGSSSTNYIAAVTAGTERMRIDSSGNLLVGTTSSSGKTTVNAGTSSATTYNTLSLIGGSSVTSQQQSTSVSTSATVILTPALYASFCVVFGSDGTNRFMDLILCTIGSGAVQVVASSTVSGTPAARTYSQSSSTYKLAMASGTYTVQVSATSMTG